MWGEVNIKTPLGMWSPLILRREACYYVTRNKIQAPYLVSVDTSLAGGFGHLVTVWLDGSVAVIFFFLRLLLAGIEQLLSKCILPYSVVSFLDLGFER